MRAEFADISSNNGHFSPVQYASAGYCAIAIKATEGTGYTNPYYGEWVAGAHRYRLPVFHYHFARPEQGNARAQADHFWNTVREHFHRPGDYLVWDMETGNPGAANGWLAEADGHLRIISGTHPIVYTYLAYLNESGLEIASNQFWIAALSSSRPGNWRWQYGKRNIFAWQNSWNTYMAGIGHCDHSYISPRILRTLHR